MPRYRCLVLDHDDTIVMSEQSLNYPAFLLALERFRPGETISLEDFTRGCFHPGFLQLCIEKYKFTQEEIDEEFLLWQDFIKDKIPPLFPGVENIVRRQHEDGGLICVVSHSCIQNITRDYETHFGILPDDIYGWDLPEEKRKPSTWPIQQIRAKYGFALEQMLVVDDMKPAWEMAGKVGAPIAFAGWGRKDYPEITEEMTRLCDFSFSSTKDLEQFLFD